MDYEKKYKEALERAKEKRDEYKRLDGEESFVPSDIEYIFPELKESEDEKIRKGLIQHLQELRKSHVNLMTKDTYDSWISWLEKQGEQKPDDKVEPKFKVGDFILNGDVTNKGKHEIFKILKVCSSWYDVENIYDGRQTMITFAQEYTCKLWTIQDAEDGDVLVTKKGNPFLYDKNRYNNELAYYYVGLDVNKELVSKSHYRMLAHFGKLSSISPATKKQRDLLFQKMKEAGYEWDAEKKELKKIDARENLTLDGDLMQADCMVVEQKSAWSEEDEKMFNSALWHVEKTCGKGGIYNWLKSIKDRVQL